MSFVERIKKDKTILIPSLFLVICLILDVLYYAFVSSKESYFSDSAEKTLVSNMILAIALLVYITVFYKSDKIQVLYPISLLIYVVLSYGSVKIFVLGCIMLVLVCKGLKNKSIFRFIIVAMTAFSIYASLVDLLWIVPRGDGYQHLLLTGVYYIIHDLLYMGAVFAIIPAATSDKGFKAYIKSTALSAEEKLKLLKQRFENGEISPEEYSKEKMEILSNI